MRFPPFVKIMISFGVGHLMGLWYQSGTGFTRKKAWLHAMPFSIQTSAVSKPPLSVNQVHHL